MNDKYILDGHEPIVEKDLLKWAKWFEKADRIVAKTQVFNEVSVSTVFLGLDYSFSDGKPFLFETMVFGGKLDCEQVRYSTWEEAEKGHKSMVEIVRKGENHVR